MSTTDERVKLVLRVCERLTGYEGPPLSTYAMAGWLAGHAPPAEIPRTPDIAKLSQALTQIAPLMPDGYNSHDGGEFKRFGKTMQRWRWHGRK